MGSQAEETKFVATRAIESRMQQAAKVAVQSVLAVKKGEQVLIITNPASDVQLISEALYDAIWDVGGMPTLIFQPKKTQLDFAEPAVIHAIKSKPDILISVSQEKLGKDRDAIRKPYVTRKKKYDHIFRYLLGTKKLRAFWSPGVTAEMFAKTVPINYKRLRDTCAKLKRYFDRAVEVRITSKLGTDITIGLRGRKAMVDDGNFTKPGKGGNLPCGELFISPELGESHGVIVFDGSISAHEGEIIISEPITMKVMDGFVTAIQGGDEAVKLRATLRKAEKMTRELGRRGKIPTREVTAYLKNIRNLGEFGIGLNDAAEIVGNMLEDEKVYGTCHIALGSNYDDDAKCLLHLDGLIKNPSIYVNNASGTVTEIMIDGKLRKNL